VRAKTGIEPELLASSGGVFEVSVDGRLLFSKRAQGRFPDDAEILTALGGCTGGGADDGV
jgi:selT/selW/selH-like putative selenoprotein